MRGTREVRDNCQLFRMVGLMDAFSIPTFTKVIEKYAEQDPKNLILDLTQITFIDSSGLGALVQLVKKLQNVGGSLQVVTNSRVTQTVKLVKLESFLSLQPSLEDAVKKLKGE
ncbi:MAG: STAS domain-containing protein [Synechococcales bacterium]|nr:STAS domain-containing protein [Synechococcales bacterium]